MAARNGWSRPGYCGRVVGNPARGTEQLSGQMYDMAITRQSGLVNPRKTPSKDRALAETGRPAMPS